MQKAKQIYQKYKVMIHNFSYLTVLKGLTLVLPLITFPYLIQTLGAQKYGLVMWAWAIAQIFIVIVKFGLDPIGVKLISENRDNKEKVSQIFSQITYMKIGLFILSIFVLLCLFFSINKISNNQNLFIYFMIFVFFESMLPVWYFQGIENMKIMAILVSSIKLIFALLVFIIVKESLHYLYIPILYAIGSFVANLVAYYIIFYKDNISFILIKLTQIYEISKESFLIFLAIIGSTLRDKGTVILIEIYLGLESVAYFDLALKIINVLLTPFHMISQVLYPHMAKTKDIFLFNKILSISIIISSLVVLLFIFNINVIIILIYGEANLIVEDIMSILIFIIPIGIISFLIGDNILIVFNKTKWTVYSMMFASFTYLLVLTFINKSSLNMFVYMYLSFFIAEMMVRIYASRTIIYKKGKNG